MRTPLIIISLFLSALLNAQTTGKILVLSNVTGQVLVDSVAVGEVVASTPFMYDVGVGEHLVQVVHGAGDTKMVEGKTIEIAEGQASAMNFIFKINEVKTVPKDAEHGVQETDQE